MKHTTKYITAKDGCKLFFSLWQGENEPHSVINLIHGIGEHCLRYEHVAAFFTAHGFAFHAFDLRGHGQSVCCLKVPRNFFQIYRKFFTDTAWAAILR